MTVATANYKAGQSGSEKTFAEHAIENRSDAVDNSMPQSFFRCPVPESIRNAKIRIGRRKVAVEVQETSIDGFTVCISSKKAPSIKIGETWQLDYDGTRTEVYPQWFFSSPDGHVQLGLRRLRDLTKPSPIKSSWFGRSRHRHIHDNNSAVIMFGGLLLAFVAVLASPGIGDKLGTSQRIQAGFKWIIQGVNQMF
ncbi:hypothetical protein CA13_47880 [Planctomycetes bacterium CA13]|uniref:Uncharacterized protein n=1 Tax=Novipirellula herctigrandis TaxID=2527986 RepID=A0A5C5Z9W5_9BACT|nr:hypothetical protein CA13_47880 [Planctomycetes bacterium CA13]